MVLEAEWSTKPFVVIERHGGVGYATFKGNDRQTFNNDVRKVKFQAQLLCGPPPPSTGGFDVEIKLEAISNGIPDADWEELNNSPIEFKKSQDYCFDNPKVDNLDFTIDWFFVGTFRLKVTVKVN